MKILLLAFFMRCAFLAPLTKLLELDFALNFFLVFFRPVIGMFAFRARKFNKSVL